MQLWEKEGEGRKKGEEKTALYVLVCNLQDILLE